ncbi:MAG: ATP synthase F1 subunit gamma [Spirochaetia bacterium]|jgi:F-type H+-transporting ATPase subunit gamma|nr:ATP synthase F1 subunit gamma [Spirochaetia bacterium]
MANLRDVRLRMRAIGQTLQVTKAMNLISTAKLRKGRRILEDTEPFFNRIRRSMYDILVGADYVHSEYFSRLSKNDKPRAAVVAVTSDRGLAGGYNANIFRTVSQLCAGLPNPVLVVCGAVGYRYFLHSPYVILENFSFKSRTPDLADAQEIADYLVSQYQWGVFDEVYVVYTYMYSTIKLAPETQRVLPLSAKKMGEESRSLHQELGKKEKIHFEYFPSAKRVFETLVPLYIKGIVYGALVEGHVSEQSARMAAMDEASKSAEDMLASLRINYNRARQAGITQEVTEIISGSAALHE